MRYLMKQKFLCLGDDFAIRDANGNDAFYVDGRAFSFGDKLSFQTPARQELAFIRQKLLSWGPTYEIYRNNQLAAVVKKELFTFLHCRFSIDVPGPDDLLATGDFLDMEYTFTRQGSPVAHVSKRFFALSDSYGIETLPNQDDILLLASAVVIDLVCHPDDNHHH